MDLGLTIFPTDQTIDPLELAKAAEDLGFESLWFPEHSHIPTDRTTPWGGRKGAPDLPEFYWRTLDQFVTLGAVAAVTSRIKIGSGITLVAQRDPIWTAKEVATVDRISNGRMLFGIGYGWNVEEMEDHGYAYNTRRARLRENILAMKQLWTEDEAAYGGDHVSLSRSWAWPKPTQSPHPPIILGGGAGPKTAAHIAEFCDGWMPIGGRHALDGLDEVNQACEAIGRDPKSVDLGMFGAKPDREFLDGLEEKGLTRAVFALPQGPRDEVMAAVEKYALLVDS